MLTESFPWLLRRSGSELQRARGAYRNPFARDRARILHSQSFRQLQGKDLLLGLDEGLVMRSRMTHAMETAQLSRGLLRALQGLYAHGEAWMPLLPDPNLLEGIAFAREMGAAPWGVGGELALNYLLREAGGFEATAQGLRVLARTEPYAEGFGLDCSRRMLLGCLQQPASRAHLHFFRVHPGVAAGGELRLDDWLPPRGFYDEDQAVVNWVLLPVSSADRQAFLQPERAPGVDSHGLAGAPSFDASIAALASAIACGVHDLEDAIVLDLIQREDWDARVPNQAWAGAVEVADHAGLGDALFGVAPAPRRRAIGTLINAIVISVEVSAREDVTEPLLRYQAGLMPEARAWLEQLLTLVQERLHHAPQVVQAARQGHTLVRELFEALANNSNTLLPALQRQAYNAALSDAQRQRLLADFIVSMGDERVRRLHAQWVGASSQEQVET